MRKGWKFKELGAVSVISYGYTESASIEPIGPRFLRITDIQDDRVDWESVPYCNITSADIPKYRLANGDIVFARTGATTGKSFLVNDAPEAVFASYLIRLRLLDKKLLPEFVSLFFQTTGYWKSIKEGSTGSAQGGFNATKLAALSIPVPPLAEQQKIVGILNEAFEAIATAKANAEKNLANASELFESYLNSVFRKGGNGWTKTTLGKVCKFHGGSQPPKAEFSKESKEGYVRLIQIRDYKTDNHVVYIQKTKAKRFCDVNDVMIGRYGPPLFQILRGIDGAYNVALMKAMPNETLITKDFLYYFLKNGDILRYIIDASSRAAGQIGLNKATLEPYPISYPNKEEQTKIVSLLGNLYDDIQRLEIIYQQKLDNLAELKQSILQKAFAGELSAQPEQLLQEAVA